MPMKFDKANHQLGFTPWGYHSGCHNETSVPANPLVMNNNGNSRYEKRHLQQRRIKNQLLSFGEDDNNVEDRRQLGSGKELPRNRRVARIKQGKEARQLKSTSAAGFGTIPGSTNER